jgi:hypothetical protein
MSQDSAADTRPAALAALGYQPVFCTPNAAGQHTPLVGTTGGADFPAYRDPPAGPYRLALRPPPDVSLTDVDDHAGAGIGPRTIKRMEAALGPLPPTWRLTSRGPDQSTGRYLYRHPAGLVITDAVFDPYGEEVTGQDGRTRIETEIQVVRTGHRFSWAEGDVNPRTGTPVVVYGPDGRPCPMPAVADLPAYPDAWVEHFRAATTHGGGHGGRTADASAAMEDWHDREGEPPAGIAAEILAAWPAARHPELGKRVLRLAQYAAGGQPGMGTLLDALADSFTAETGRGDAEVYDYLTWWLERPQLWPSARDAEGWAKMGFAPGAVAARLVAQNGPVTAPATAAGASLLARVKTGAWLDGQVFAPLHYHVPGLVPEGLTVLTGPPKIGKSWLVLLWLLDLARAGNAVLYLALEDSDRRMQWRCRRLLGSEPVPEALRYMTEEDVVPGMLLPTVAQFVADHHDRAPLVVLDTLAKAMQQTPRIRDEAAYERDYRVTSELQAAVKGCPGAGLLIAHHDRKTGGEDWVDRISGTKGITGGPDVVMYLERKRTEAAGALHVTGRDIAEEDYAMTFADACRWTFDGGSLPAARAAYIARKAQAGLGRHAADIVALAHARGAEGITRDDAAGATGLTPHQASEYLRRLADESGRLRRAARGLYTCVCSVCSPPAPPVPPPHNTHNTRQPTSSQPAPVTANGTARPGPAAACVLAGHERPPGLDDAGWAALHAVCCGVPGCGGPGG